MPELESQDAAAISISRARAVLTLIAQAGDRADRETLLEATEVALDEVARASAALDGHEKKPGKSRASVVIERCGGDAVVCHLRSAAAS